MLNSTASQNTSHDLSISAEDLRSLSGPSDLWGTLDLLNIWTQIIAILLLSFVTDNWWTYLVAAVLIASRQHALIILAHEAWHRLCFRNASLNHTVGAWLYSYPVGLPYRYDRKRHLQHHKCVGQEIDPDWTNYTSNGRESCFKVLFYLFSLLCGRLLFSTAWSVILHKRTRIPTDTTTQDRKESSGVLREYTKIAICQGFIFLMFSVAFSWKHYFLLWALPIVTLTAFCANLRALVEHVSQDGQEDKVESRLRDIDATAFERCFFSPYRFHLHALHHTFPSVPHRNLPRLKHLLTNSNGSYPIEVWPGYLRSLYLHLKNLPS